MIIKVVCVWGRGGRRRGRGGQGVFVCVLACLCACVCIQLCVCFMVPSFASWQSEIFHCIALEAEKRSSACSYDWISPPQFQSTFAHFSYTLPKWGLIVPRILPPTPVLYSVYVHKTPQTHQKTPLFLARTWKWAKPSTVWAKWPPTGQNVRKVGKTFLEVGKLLLLLFMLLILQAFSLIFRSLALDFYSHGTVTFHFIH